MVRRHGVQRGGMRGNGRQWVVDCGWGRRRAAGELEAGRGSSNHNHNGGLHGRCGGYDLPLTAHCQPSCSATQACKSSPGSSTSSWLGVAMYSVLPRSRKLLPMAFALSTALICGRFLRALAWWLAHCSSSCVVASVDGTKAG